jgi:hypothetical protein
MIILCAFFSILRVEVVYIKKPNSICKNKNCQKLFYSCAFCTHQNAWRAVACSPECFDEYAAQVAEARSKGKLANILPERIDMTEGEVQQLLNKSIEEVKEITQEELKDYSDDIKAIGLTGAIDKMNDEIRETEIEVVTKTRKKKNIQID